MSCDGAILLAYLGHGDPKVVFRKKENGVLLQSPTPLTEMNVTHLEATQKVGCFCFHFHCIGIQYNSITRCNVRGKETFMKVNA